jgi:hypothetical protein
MGQDGDGEIVDWLAGSLVRYRRRAERGRPECLMSRKYGKWEPPRDRSLEYVPDEPDDDEGPSDEDLAEFGDDDAEADVSPCPHCKTPIYEDSFHCPSCGQVLVRRSTAWMGWVTSSFVLLLTALIIFGILWETGLIRIISRFFRNMF